MGTPCVSLRPSFSGYCKAILQLREQRCLLQAASPGLPFSLAAGTNVHMAAWGDHRELKKTKVERGTGWGEHVMKAGRCGLP